MTIAESGKGLDYPAPDWKSEENGRGNPTFPAADIQFKEKGHWVDYLDAPLRPYRFLAIIEPDDGGFSAYSPSLPGAAGQGDSIDKAVLDLKDSIAELIASYRQEEQAWPVEPDPEVPEGEGVVARWIVVNA